MSARRSCGVVWSVWGVLAAGVLSEAALAGWPDGVAAVPELKMSYGRRPQQGSGGQAPATAPARAEGVKPEAEEGEGLWGYRGVSSFFNIREANSNVRQGEWEFEFIAGWKTQSDGEDDEIELEQSLKFGVTDEFHVELEVVQPTIGDGGESGAGDLNLTLFYTFLKETEALPALGGFGEMRIPSGDGSSGVDGTFSLIATKTFARNCRAHFQGYVKTANGSSGADEGERRYFQWGLGPGFDYRINDNNLVLLNYLHRSSEEEEVHNANILEFGSVHKLGRIGPAEHELKLAFDVGLDGSIGTPNFAGRVLWGVEWK